MSRDQIITFETKAYTNLEKLINKFDLDPPALTDLSPGYIYEAVQRGHYHAAKKANLKDKLVKAVGHARNAATRFELLYGRPTPDTDGHLLRIKFYEELIKLLS